MIALTPNRRLALKILGYVGLGLFTFVLALHYTFPYDRVKDKIEDALSDRYDVTIGSAGPGLIPGHMKLEDVKLATRPEREDEEPKVLEISSVDINLGVLALIGGDTDVEFEAEVGDGTVEGHIVVSETSMSIDIDTSDMPLESVPFVGAIAGGAPMQGAMDAKIRLRLPKKKWRDAHGSIRLACAGCVMGDGKTKMRPTAGKARNAFSEGGFTLDPTRLGDVKGVINIEKGVACIEELTASSPDGELNMEGGIKFDDPFARSQAQLYAKFRVTDDFKAKNDRMAAIVNGIPTKGRRDDGFFGYSARDALGSLAWRPAKENPAPMRECGMSGAVAEKPKKEKKEKKPRGKKATTDTGEIALDRGGEGVPNDGLGEGMPSTLAPTLPAPPPAAVPDAAPAGGVTVRPTVAPVEEDPPGPEPLTDEEGRPVEPAHDTDPDSPQHRGEEGDEVREEQVQ